MSSSFSRTDGRPLNTMRPVSITPGIAPNALGSVLISFGATQVICAATLDTQPPRWMQRDEAGGGWMNAEYSMLPYSTLERKQRDISRGKQDGRSIEIQRLIGRSLRAVADLKRLPPSTLWVDCDVLQADGGTRTASITGAYIAAKMAVRRAMEKGLIAMDPFLDSVAAISVGICEETPLLDLCYEEDFAASVDANVVMTGAGRIVEVQASGEEATYTREQLDALLVLAQKGISELTALQEQALQA